MWESRTLSYSGRKRGGAGVSASGRGASGRSNSSRPRSSRKVSSRGRSRSITARRPRQPDQVRMSRTSPARTRPGSAARLVGGGRRPPASGRASPGDRASRGRPARAPDPRGGTCTAGTTSSTACGERAAVCSGQRSASSGPARARVRGCSSREQLRPAAASRRGPPRLASWRTASGAKVRVQHRLHQRAQRRQSRALTRWTSRA